VHRAETIELSFGPARWFPAANGVLFALGILAILVSPANGPWKLAFIAMLTVVTLLAVIHTFNSHRAGIVRIHYDYSVDIYTKRGTKGRAYAGAHCWVSRWFSVLTLVDEHSNSRLECLIFASNNSPDAYRRLLAAMRMRSATSAAHGANR
jgi:hypothetical protein